MTQTIRLKNIRIVDTKSGEISEPLDLTIADKRIVDIGVNGDTDIGDIRELECDGKYAIPGLFDCHTHLATLTNQSAEVQRAIFDECRLSEPFQEGCLKELILPDFVRSGVTQVRDLGGPVETLRNMKQDVDDGRITGPDIFYAGPMLEMPPLTISGMNERWPGWTVAIESKDHSKEIMTMLFDKGIACLKVFGRFSDNVLKSFVSHAESMNLPVTCDPGRTFFHNIDIPKGIDLGIRCFEHAKSLWYPALKDNLKDEHDRLRNAGPKEQTIFIQRLMNDGPESISFSKLGELADIMNAADALLCPTLHICKFYSEKPEVFSDSDPEKFGPIFATLFDVGSVIVNHFAKHGVRMLVGQDGYIARFTHEEMILMAQCGLNAVDIIKGATIYPAEWNGIADKYGSIEIGKKANLVILDKDPVKDIRNIRSIHSSIFNGQIVFRDV